MFLTLTCMSAQLCKGVLPTVVSVRKRPGVKMTQAECVCSTHSNVIIVDKAVCYESDRCATRQAARHR